MIPDTYRTDDIDYIIGLREVFYPGDRVGGASNRFWPDLAHGRFPFCEIAF